MPKDTATYKPVTCYQCGDTMRAYTFKDVWDMRIDNVLHKVPLYSVPCMRCDACDIAVTDGGSDEAIEWSYKRYIREQGLNTPWLRCRRYLRRLRLRIYDRYNWYRLQFDKWRGKYD
jgi:hypothetical protein